MENNFYWILKKMYSLSFNISSEKEECEILKTLDELTMSYFRSLLIKAMMYLKTEDTKRKHYIDIVFDVEAEADTCTYIIQDKNIIVKFINDNTIKLLSIESIGGN